MPIVIRRKNSLRNQMLALILLSLLAGIIGGSLVGFVTGHHGSSTQTSAPTS
jgi:hypothetical protein